MNKGDLIYHASLVVAKGYSYEDYKYGDALYGKEHFIDGIWEYVEEYIEIGRKEFYKKYSKYNLYY